ncbi:MAG: PepSY domain-containing protein, partial [Pseudomonadota bacterium]|nr:PepSY domain-containing protein [Pseudomonadota bacterium]
PGDANARVVIDGHRPGSLSDLNRKIYDRQGRLLAVRDGVRDGPGWRAYAALVPLHFGDFGGLAVKLAYFLFGLAAVAMPISGGVLWLDRQRRHPVLGRHVPRLHRLLVGVAAGFWVALAGLFVIDKLGPESWSAQAALTGLFFLLWGLALAWALCRRRAAQALGGLLLAAGVLLMTAAIADGVSALERPTAVQITDAVLLALGAGLAAAGWRFRRWPPPLPARP